LAVGIEALHVPFRLCFRFTVAVRFDPRVIVLKEACTLQDVLTNVSALATRNHAKNYTDKAWLTHMKTILAIAPVPPKKRKGVKRGRIGHDVRLTARTGSMWQGEEFKRRHCKVPYVFDNNKARTCVLKKRVSLAQATLHSDYQHARKVKSGHETTDSDSN